MIPSFLRLFIFALAVSSLLAACTSSPPVLEEGRWTGALTPMNHPEMTNPIAYEVRSGEEGLTIDLVGAGDTPIPTRRPHLEGDTLAFSFTEPEEQVLLACSLGRVGSEGFAGRCTDESGKWARFTMEPPAME